MRPRRNFQLARIFGIRIGVSASWFFVLFLLIFYLSGYFNNVVSGTRTTDYLIAVAGALGYFVSLILHELGHALMARRLGIGIVGIDLWFFGGLSQMRREPGTPGEEFKIAAAGPAVTLLLFVICVAAGSLLASGHTFTEVALTREGFRTTPALALAGWLGFVNAILFIFNVVPAFPLDGGRIARAIIWRRTGDRNRATQATGRRGTGPGAGPRAAGPDQLRLDPVEPRPADHAARLLPLPGGQRGSRPGRPGKAHPETSGSPTSWTGSP